MNSKAEKWLKCNIATLVLFGRFMISALLKKVIDPTIKGGKGAVFRLG
ncbi:hypothetical protein [Bacillus sp. BA3]|nr:hypothetical protein [Bacillus sp. BA3]